ncbi:MAG: hypothetical protein PHD31_02000 [Candidatus Pacebacteria bacterium]|nr:hypothetical protein [Candidatus Paceibacterota bacterium]
MLKINKIKLFSIALISFFGTFFAQAALAICPVCTIATTTGVGLARWLKIDDSVTGLWIGALTISMVAWTIEWLKKKDIDFPGMGTIVFVAYYFLAIWPLRSFELIGNQNNLLWGFDKLILGIALGTIFFFLSEEAHKLIKKKNNDKSFIPYQRVALPISTMLILTILFYFLTR